MIFVIPDLLNGSELSTIKSILTEAKFVDGKLTAGWYAKPVKHNQQLPTGDLQQQLKQQIQTALSNNPLFQTAIRPKAIHNLLFSRYEVGMSYGRHVDNAFMGGWRSDVSFTLFLSSPNNYQGGELIIESADDEKAYKLEAGSVLVYPSTTLHRVEPVTAGIRLAAVGWVQSLIRDSSKREILFDLETVKRVMYNQSGKTAEFDLLAKSISNLLRQWAE
ncbi:MAG: Fe2+-dependent dioxygenase [Cyanobacteria bacterium J083]|nr:MAG: Fe2+-dependent dioxygenase [Cyanobacteria bacterium J083]